MRRSLLLPLAVAAVLVAAPSAGAASIWTPIDSGQTTGAITAIEYQGPDRFWYATSNGKLARRVGDVWRWDDPRAGGRVVMAERDGMVVTVVGDESPEAVLAALRALPDLGDPEPMGRKVRRAVGDLLDWLSPTP